jgi:hypothetical protein
MPQSALSHLPLWIEWARALGTLALLAFAGAISFLSYRIARWQGNIANERLRLDLYNRRFEIFTSIFDMYAALISWTGTPEQIAVRAKFFRGYHESGFLFRQSSGIEDLLKGLNDDANKVIAFKENPNLYKYDHQIYLQKFQEINDIQTTGFENGLLRLKAAMAEYLYFGNIIR